jgi:hypothetical protein
MKKIGIGLMALSFVMGILSGHLPQGFPMEPFVALSFFYFLLGIYALILDKDETT